mgnify:FL=1
MSNQSQLKAVEKRLNKFVNRDVPAARVTATNKTLAKVKTRVVRAIAISVKVKVGAVRKRVYISRAKGDRKAKFHVYRRAIPMISMGARQNKKGVRAGKQFKAGAFIADGSKGFGRGVLNRAQVLKRTGRGQYPLEVITIPIAKFVDDITPKVVGRVFKSDFARLYQHEINRRAQRT